MSSSSWPSLSKTPAPTSVDGMALAAAATAAAASSSSRPSDAAAALPPTAPAAAASPSAPIAGIVTLPFHALCQLLERLEHSKWSVYKGKKGPGGGQGRMARCERMLSAFFDKCASLGGDPLPLMVLLLPDADLDRRFDCKETTLVSLLVRGFSLTRTRTAEALKQWRTGVQQHMGTLPARQQAMGPTLSQGQGDLSMTIHALMATYAASLPTLTVGQVNARLDALAASSRWSTQEFRDGLALQLPTVDADADADEVSRARLVYELYSRCTSLEHKWLTRILLRNLNVSIKARTIMDAFHPHLHAIYLRRGSLREACTAVRQLMHADHKARATGGGGGTAAAAASSSGPTARDLKRKRVSSFDGEDGYEDEDDAIAAATPDSVLARMLAPRVGSFVQVMLCQRAHSVPFAESKFRGKDVSITPKYDGERVQVHVWRNDNMDAQELRAFAEQDGLGVTWHSGRYCVRIYSRSARNSTLDRQKCIPAILAALGLKGWEDGWVPPAPAAASSSVPIATTSVKCEDEPFSRAASVMPALERPFASSSAQAGVASAASSSASRPVPIPPFVQCAKAAAFRSVILDGELLVFNELTREIEPFGGLCDLVPRGVPRVGPSGIGNINALTHHHRHHILVMFDILHYNGENVMEQPQRTRMRVLKEVVPKARPDWVEVIKETIVRMPSAASASSPAAAAAGAIPSTAPTLHSLYLDCVARRDEGLILKDCSSRYIPNHRAHWLKLKRDYIPGFGDSVDLCIVGAQYGMGAQGGLLNCFTLAVRRNDPNAGRTDAAAARDGSNLHFQALGEVGIGLTADEAHQMHHLLKPLCVPYKSRGTSCPSWLSLPRGLAMHVVLRDPRRAVVVEVLGSGFIGLALRFPRILRVKPGVTYEAALGLEEYVAIAVKSCSHLTDQEKKDMDVQMRQMAQAQLEVDPQGRPAAREGRIEYQSSLTAPTGAAAVNPSAHFSILGTDRSIGAASSAARVEPSSSSQLLAPRAQLTAAPHLAVNPPAATMPIPQPTSGSVAANPGANTVGSAWDFALDLFERSQEAAVSTQQRMSEDGDESADEPDTADEAMLDGGDEEEPEANEQCAIVEPEPEVKVESTGQAAARVAVSVKPEDEHTVKTKPPADTQPQSVNAPSLMPLVKRENAAEDAAFHKAASVGTLLTPPRPRRQRAVRPLRSPPHMCCSPAAAAHDEETLAPCAALLTVIPPNALVPATAAASVSAAACIPPSAATAAPRVNPKKLWECPQSAPHTVTLHISTPPGLTPAPSAWRPCACRRIVWLDSDSDAVSVSEPGSAASAASHVGSGQSVSLPASVRQFLQRLGFVLLERGEWAHSASQPSIVVTRAAAGAVPAVVSALQSPPRQPSEVPSPCSSRPVWIVDERFSEYLHVHVHANTTADATAPIDARAMRKRLYAALARGFVRAIYSS